MTDKVTEPADLSTDSLPWGTQPPQDGEKVLYEPRALWDWAVLNPAVDAPNRPHVHLRRNHFRNGSRHTMVLTRLLLSPIGYTFRDNFGAAGNVQEEFRNAQTAIAELDVHISAPFRQHMTRNFVPSLGLQMEPTGMPSMRQHPDRPFASSMFGVFRWNFDAPYALPRKGGIHFEMSSYVTPEHPSSFERNNPQNAILFEEAWDHGGRFRGNGRFRPRQELQSGEAALTEIWPSGHQPLPLDNFSAGVGGIASLWNAGGQFVARDFKRQDRGRGAPHSWVTGLAVHVDQIDYDQFLQDERAVVTDQPVAPISSKVITRCKTTDGGTGEWWWKPGAPLSLVTPTIGEAIVYKLPEPIVLGPYESLDVELRGPPDEGIAGTVEYNMGCSLTGYAIVEG